MPTASLKPFSGVVLTLFLALTMGLVGFAHRAPSLSDEAVAAYALQGVALADLCGEDGKAMADGGGCPACHVAAGITLPSPLRLLRQAELRLVATVIAPRESRALRIALNPAHGSRAPPSV
jgi:hypothetical protein